MPLNPNTALRALSLLVLLASALPRIASAQCPAAGNVAAESRGCSIRLSWALAPGALPPQMWEIWRNTVNSTAGGGGVVLSHINTGNDFTYDDVPPARGVTYYYFIRGNGVLPGTCPGGPAFSASVHGAMPDRLAAPSVTVDCSGVILSWDEFPDASTVTIYRSINTETTEVALVTRPGFVTSYIDRAGVPGVFYRYRVEVSSPCINMQSLTTLVMYPGVAAAYTPAVSAAVDAGQTGVLRFFLNSNTALNPIASVRLNGAPISIGPPPAHATSTATASTPARGCSPSPTPGPATAASTASPSPTPAAPASRRPCSPSAPPARPTSMSRVW
jgi:hypothetical protein